MPIEEHTHIKTHNDRNHEIESEDTLCVVRKEQVWRLLLYGTRWGVWDNGGGMQTHRWDIMSQLRGLWNCGYEQTLRCEPGKCSVTPWWCANSQMWVILLMQSIYRGNLMMSSTAMKLGPHPKVQIQVLLLCKLHGLSPVMACFRTSSEQLRT